MKKAFSLVELMVTLIIISCIMASLAPSITKKLNSGEIIIGGKSTIINTQTEGFKMNCEKFGENCSLCDENICAVCSKNCEFNQTLNISECTCKNCSEIIDENCEQCSLNACQLCKSGYYVLSGKCTICPSGYKCDGISKTQCSKLTYSQEGASECIDCTSNCKECDSTSGECSICDTNYTLNDNKCILNNCGELALKISLSGKDMCITKYNIGDVSGLSLPASELSIVPAGSGTCNPSSTTFCCWVGTTSTSCSSNNGGYSGCTRTICDGRAAIKICESLTYLNKTWQLPSSNELALIGSQLETLSFGQGENGIMLCDSENDSLSARCGRGACSGAPTNACRPYDVWSGTPSDTSSAYAYDLSNGVWGGPYSNSYQFAGSVRCVSYL